MKLIDLGKSAKEREELILLAIICISVGIFAADILTPLGILVWILYCIPVVMTVWLPYRIAPIVTAMFLMGALLFGSIIGGSQSGFDHDITERMIFFVLLAIIALLVSEIQRGYASLQHEITERRRIDNALIQATKKLALLSGITRHDIRNQLAILMGHVELLKEDYPEGSARQSIDVMERCALVIRERLNFSKSYEDLGVNAPLWQDFRRLFRFAVSQRNPAGITVQVDIPRILVFADPMLEKVLFNLIDNTVKHSKGASEIRLSHLETGAGLVLVYEDNGIGISDDKKVWIFEVPKGGKTSMGLFLVREILAITGISIMETGMAGQGARFEISVPPGIYRVEDRPEQGLKQ